jgi:membrane protein insertase Oxa1/YidC/SpoIIIJ
MMLMELYKEREISPFGSMGTLIVQLVILIGLYSGLRRVVTDPHAIIQYSYSWLHNLPGLKALAENANNFDATLFGVVDLTRAAINKTGGIYFPALLIVLGSAVAQFYQSKQLMPNPKDGRKLRDILRDANSGKQAEQSEVSAAVGQSTRYILPVFIIMFTINIASALSLYWLVGGIVAYIQQSKVLGQDETEMEAVADKPDKTVIEGEVIAQKPKQHKKKSSKKTHKGRKK